MRKFSQTITLALASIVLLVLGPATALAATAPAASAPAANGYRLSPVRTDLTIKPGANEAVTVYIQNASSAVEDLQVVIDDFQAPTNESGDPALLLNGQTASSHSLKQFVSVPVPTFTLQPNQQQAVTVNIKVPLSTASGGYYGAIRFAPVGIGGSKNVNLSASIASLVLLTVPGNLDEQLSIASFGVAHNGSVNPQSFFFSNKNLQAVVSFRNSGNVQEQPFGKILLKKGSTSLASFSVNGSDDPGNVLPDSARRFTVSLDKVGWFGKYKVEGNFGYGSKGQLLTATATFYVIPILVIIIAVLIIIFIVFLLLGLPRLIRSYNRRVIARANRRS